MSARNDAYRKNFTPLVYMPLPQALPYADEVIPGLIEIARHGWDFMHLPYGFADRMRNEAARRFLEGEHSHLVMLDSDHRHQHDIVNRLLGRILEEPTRQIVGGLNFKRCEPYDPCAYLFMDDRVGVPHEWMHGVVEVDAVGFGAVIIAREVFEAVEWPWFVNEPQAEAMRLGSHDIYFCRKAKAHGFRVWVDTTLTSPHITTHTVGEQTYRTWHVVNGQADEIGEALSWHANAK